MARTFKVTYGIRWVGDDGGGRILTGMTFDKACTIAAEVKTEGGAGVSVWQDGARARTGRYLAAVKMHDV